MLRAIILLLVFSGEVLAQTHVEYKAFPSKVLGREIRYGIYLPPSDRRSNRCSVQSSCCWCSVAKSSPRLTSNTKHFQARFSAGKYGTEFICRHQIGGVTDAPCNHPAAGVQWRSPRPDSRRIQSISKQGSRPGNTVRNLSAAIRSEE